MLKKYDELTAEQKKRVSVMYADLTDQGQYLYNFDDKGKYHGRQYAPPVSVVRADPVEESKPETAKPKRKTRKK